MLPLTGFEKSTVKSKVLDDTFVQPLFFNFHLGINLSKLLTELMRHLHVQMDANALLF
jgi:hypothetical protein